MNIYVGNLSFNVTETDLREAFQAFGTVEKAAVITDKGTGQSRGFGFVEMPNREEAMKAIGALNGKDLKGRALKVNLEGKTPSNDPAAKPSPRPTGRAAAGIGCKIGLSAGAAFGQDRFEDGIPKSEKVVEC
jgi:RNA recognition motif-containing protein